MNLYKVGYSIMSIHGKEDRIEYYIADNEYQVFNEVRYHCSIYLCIENVKILPTEEKQPQTYEEYREYLKVHDPIAYYEMTSNPTGVDDNTDAEFTGTFYVAIIAFAMGVGLTCLLKWII